MREYRDNQGDKERAFIVVAQASIIFFAINILGLIVRHFL